MKQTWYARLAFCALLAALTACSRGADNGAAGTVKLNINGQPVINHLYIEVNDTDPRVALGYIMEKSKKPFFDHVVLFAANLRDRDCAAEKQQGGGADHDCYKSGVHLHFNGNVQHILDNRAVYIKPLQDKGVKVQLGLLADWGGVTFGTLGGWPLGPRDDAYPYALNNTLDDNAQLNTTETAGAAYAKQNGYKESRWEGGYPYTETVRDAFLNEVKAALDKYELDGIDLDDEYGSKSIYAGEYVYPKTSGTQWYDGQPRPVYHYYGNNKGKTAAALADGGKIMAKVAISAR